MKLFKSLGMLTLLLFSGLCFADTPTPNKGDTTWVLIATVLVITGSL